jgi:hypothetical protein
VQPEMLLRCLASAGLVIGRVGRHSAEMVRVGVAEKAALAPL